ncbi:MAG: type IX secretion system outer membrane channel protein PorV [Bacteroidales bacterium]|nr:type IX secretion system outer membrane channel protein PorV [Bacteroidales bacterium]MDZ4203909.1 type IX secretion system outer membrane channel protein PorV [Bacteroidales bacterium]
MRSFFASKRLLWLAILLMSFSFSYAQRISRNDKLRVVTSAVPFLLIAPDARAGSLGDVGAATIPDINSLRWNPAKLSFIEKDMGFSMAYSPWLRGLVNDINLSYLAGYKRLDENQTIGGSLLYFSAGDIQYTDWEGNDQGIYRPSEFAIDATYSRKFSDHISGAVSARFIHSNLTSGQYVGTLSTKPGTSVAADVAVYYQKPVELFSTDAIFAWGLNISNIGSKISYSDDNTQKDFIPTHLRIGPALTFDLDDYNRLSFMFDLNKMLVPTPPIWATDSLGKPITGADGNQIISKGKNPEVSVPVGMLQSFYDAPNGFSEELQEFSVGVGVEYWYDKQFAIRGGYFYENQYKGGRQFFTLGVGLRYNVFGLDFSYLVPTTQRHPLENTLRFTLSFDFDAFKAQGAAIPPQVR